VVCACVLRLLQQVHVGENWESSWGRIYRSSQACAGDEHEGEPRPERSEKGRGGTWLDGTQLTGRRKGCIGGGIALGARCRWSQGSRGPGRDVSGRDPPVAGRPAALHAWLHGRRIRYEAMARRPIAVFPRRPALAPSPSLPPVNHAGTGTALIRGRHERIR
jgi:hypothetical protein